MNCPYKSIGIMDRWIDSCGPLEAIYVHSGLDQKEARYSSQNVLRAYTAITLDDISRDGKIIVRSFAKKFRDKLGKTLPKELNQYIIGTNQKIAIMEKSNANLEEYLYAIGKMGGEIFNLAVPSGAKYDKNFIMEAGRLSTQTMVLDDMKKDLPDDLKHKNYNPLKIPETRSRFNDLYAKTKNELKSLMEKINFQNITQNLNEKYNFCSDKKGSCDTDDVITCIGLATFINCILSPFYIPLFDLRNFPVLKCEYKLVGNEWQWVYCEPRGTGSHSDKCACLYPDCYLWLPIGLLPYLIFVSFGCGGTEEDDVRGM